MKQAASLLLDERTVEVTISRSSRARRISLRIDPAHGIVLTLPLRARLEDGLRFLDQTRPWIAQRLDKIRPALPWREGTAVPILGRPHLLCHHPHAARGVWTEEDRLCVSGQAEHMSRRITDFLKRQARNVMTAKATDMAARIGRRPGRISIKDTRSRWGSCSSQGSLSLSWRLIMAPEWVLDYVVGHEVAHLAQMNHSPAFWAVVHSLVGDPRPAKAWLKRHGPDLHRYGDEAL